MECVYNAHSGDVKIGFCKFVFNQEFAKGYIHDIRVAAEYARKGLGRKLLKKTENYLISKKIEQLNGMAVAECPEIIDQDNLKRWWCSRGYEVQMTMQSENSNCIGTIHKTLI